MSRLDVSEMLGMIIALQDVRIDDSIVKGLRSIQHRVRLEYAEEEQSSNVGRPRLEIPVQHSGL